MKQMIEVIYSINGTTHTDVFAASKSSVTMGNRGRTAIKFIDGRDESNRPVNSAQYKEAYRVIRYEADDPVTSEQLRGR